MALLPLLGSTWVLGLLFLIDSDSEPLAWIFTILNSLQVSNVIHITVSFKNNNIQDFTIAMNAKFWLAQ